MRLKYHVIIGAEDKQPFERSLDTIGGHIISTYHNADDEHHYVVDLSKYELLSVRVSCKTGRFITMAKETI